MYWIQDMLKLAVLITVFALNHPASSQTSLSAADKQELLDAHNLFRGMVDPPASNMQRLVSKESRVAFDPLLCTNGRLLQGYI